MSHTDAVRRFLCWAGFHDDVDIATMDARYWRCRWCGRGGHV